eukprot:TRINITY_DN10636_c0_g1_i1.p1 TRINITY_DN10636_c0_g1~~TRINITY_DN10636_c0_g1_i1.p1  ORF type:complete len:133 (+),score=21.26 TRINITY_DN10636_c0_g1_i1:185-583(+)
MSVRGKLGTRIPQTKEEWQTREKFRFRCQSEIAELAAATQAQKGFHYSEEIAGPMIASRICFLNIDCANQLEAVKQCLESNNIEADPKQWPWAKTTEGLAAVTENTNLPVLGKRCENVVNALRNCSKGGKSL